MISHKFQGTKMTNKVFILVICTLMSPAALGYVVNDQSVTGLMKAYTFLLGQDRSLSRIAKAYPDLQAEVLIARRSFNAAFPGIREELEANIKKAIGEKTLHKYINKLRHKIDNLLPIDRVTKEKALNFLAKVNARANGQIKSPIFEYLLSAQFDEHPAKEFLAGYRTTFRTTGKGKSRGVELNLELPRSWKAEDGDHPHIVKTWTSQYGTGLQTIMLQIRDLPKSIKNGRVAKFMVSSGRVKESVPEGMRYIDSGVFTLETEKGYWVEYTGIRERMGLSFYTHSKNHYLFFWRQGNNHIVRGWRSREK